jgi:DNA-binding Lrp family transcriptional regulator
MVEIDGLDRQVVHALGIDGRAAFSRIAAALGVSDQTVARRYRRLRSAGVLRVLGRPDPVRLGYAQWFIRLRCTPDAAGSVATALARRPDTIWVTLVSGGTEIVCVTQARSHQDRDTLLLQKLPRTNRVISVSAHSILKMFVGGPVGWPGLATALTPDQVERLRPPAADRTAEVVHDAGDEALFEVLGRDGRTGYAELAAATGWSESTVKRRMDHLRATGALYYDVDFDVRLRGYNVDARLWMSVPPAHLAGVAEAIARHPEIGFLGATTGPTNLLASVVCRDDSEFYEYVTTKLGAIEAIQHLETAPVIRTVKRAGALLQATPQA